MVKEITNFGTDSPHHCNSPLSKYICVDLPSFRIIHRVVRFKKINGVQRVFTMGYAGLVAPDNHIVLLSSEELPVNANVSEVYLPLGNPNLASYFLKIISEIFENVEPVYLPLMFASSKTAGLFIRSDTIEPDPDIPVVPAAVTSVSSSLRAGNNLTRDSVQSAKERERNDGRERLLALQQERDEKKMKRVAERIAAKTENEERQQAEIRQLAMQQIISQHGYKN